MAGKRPRKGSAGVSGRSARARSRETHTPCPTLTHSHLAIFGWLDFSKILGARVLVRCDSGARARAWGLTTPPPAVCGHESRQMLGSLPPWLRSEATQVLGAGKAMWLPGGALGMCVTRTSLQCTFLGESSGRLKQMRPQTRASTSNLSDHISSWQIHKFPGVWLCNSPRDTPGTSSNSVIS